MRALLGVELPGFRPVGDDAWANDHDDVLSLHFFALAPDLPAALDDGPALRNALTHHTARAGGGLIEASVQVGDQVHRVFLLAHGESPGRRGRGLQPVACALQSSTGGG